MGTAMHISMLILHAEIATLPTMDGREWTISLHFYFANKLRGHSTYLLFCGRIVFIFFSGRKRLTAVAVEWYPPVYNPFYCC